MVAIYHRVYRRENFEIAANDLIGLIYAAQEQQPDIPRALYVDIDGHRNKAGGFDDDMLELQKEFGIGFLLQFVKEVHFPLGSVINKGEQRNDVPEKLVIGNARNERDSSLEELYIENYSNTEFVSEEDVQEFMSHLSNFLRNYQDFCSKNREQNDFDPAGWLGMWRNHIVDLMIESFNSFVHGNLLVASAMTRSLIECYVYISILKQEQSEELMNEWWICNIIHKIKPIKGQKEEKIKAALKEYCESCNIDFEAKWKYYTQKEKSSNAWLKHTNKLKKIGFNSLCEFINEPEIYADYESACSYVHAQGLLAILHFFTFYSTIYGKLYCMLLYMFKTIRLFETNEALEQAMDELECELLELGENYLT